MNKPVKTTLPVTITLLLMLFLFISCGPAPSRKALAALDGLDPGEQTVNVWYQADPGQEQFMEALIGRFNSENPWKIRIEGTNRGYSRDLWNSVSEVRGTGRQPDLVLMTPNPEKELPRAEDTADLFPYVVHKTWGGASVLAGEDWKSIRDNSWKAYLVRQDKEWTLPGLPVTRDLNLVYYNIDRLAQLGQEGFPQTREAFRQICEAALLQPDFSGFIFPPEAQTPMTLSYARGWGSRDKDGRFVEDETELQNSEAFILNMVKSGAAGPAREKFDGQMEFSAGGYVFSLDTASGLEYYERSVRTEASPFEWSAAPFPPETEKGSVSAWDRCFFLLPSDEARQLAAWLFVRWCLAPETQVLLAESGKMLPVNPGAYPLLRENAGDNPRYLKVIEFGQTLPVQPFLWREENQVFFSLLTREFRNSLGL